MKKIDVSFVTDYHIFSTFYVLFQHKKARKNKIIITRKFEESNFRGYNCRDACKLGIIQ